MAVDTTYQVQQGESPDAYASRIAAYNASKDTSTTAPSSDFISQLQTKLLGQSDIISSESTNIESRINQAIAGVQKGQEAGAAGVTSQFEREKALAAEAGQQRLTSAQESQRGFATNTAALDKLQKDTDTQLKDLEQRKQELILQGQAAAAGQISQLQLQAIQFRQQAQQQVFSNLLGMANFGLQAQQQAQQQKNFETTFQFQRDQALSDITLKYGVQPKAGETFTAFADRAVKEMGANSPAALEIQQIKAQIASAQASAAVSRMQLSDRQALANLDVETLGTAYNQGKLDITMFAKDPAKMALIMRAGDAANTANAKAEVDRQFANGISKSTVIQLITSEPNVANKPAILEYVQSKYGDNENPGGPKEPRTLAGDVGTIARGAGDTGAAISDYIFGPGRGRSIAERQAAGIVGGPGLQAAVIAQQSGVLPNLR